MSLLIRGCLLIQQILTLILKILVDNKITINKNIIKLAFHLSDYPVLHVVIIIYTKSVLGKSKKLKLNRPIINPSIKKEINRCVKMTVK